MNVRALQGAAGNRAVARLLQRDGAAPATAPAPAPQGTDQAIIDREDRAFKALEGLRGGTAGTFTYGNPMSPDYAKDNSAPTATLTLGALVPRPTTDTDKRRSFDSQAAAQAFAAFNPGPAGAAVLKSDTFWFAASLTATSASSLAQPNVYRFAPGPSVVSAIGTDGFVFTDRTYMPDTGQVQGLPDAEKHVASPASAEEMRKLVGVRPDDPAGPKGAPGMKIPAGQEEAFITTYLRSRALEALEENRKQADGLEKDFKPGADGKLGKNATDLISKTRALGAVYQQLEDDEKQVGEMALTIWEKHLEGKWNNITVKGRTQKYHAWIDEINGQLATIAEGKEATLSLSPMLASMVRHDATPKNAGDWAAKLGWERSTFRKVAMLHPVIWGLSKLGDMASDSASGVDKWGDSELSKKGSEEGDKKAAEQFRLKLDSVEKAISKTYGKVTGGDADYLLGMGGLRSRVGADINRLGEENKGVKDKWKDMCQTHDMVEEAIDIGGTVVQIGALFLPGGQFISAAIGMGMQMRTMNKHLDHLDAANAAVDPAKALVDQQELAQTLLFDTLNIAIQAVDLATSFNGVLSDLEAGRAPKDVPGSEATDPTGKHVGDKDVPAAPLKPGEVPKTGTSAGMSDKFSKTLTELGIPGGNPYGGVNTAAVHKACGNDWNAVKAKLLRGGENAADEMAGQYVMHQMTAYRSAVTNGRLEAICARLTKETGVVHEVEAVGSTALTSDLDFSIKGPRAGEAVKEFNAEFRKSFGVESGVAFDSNVYTRSAHLDFPLTAKPGEHGVIPIDAAAKGEWDTFKGKSLGAASDAEKGRLKSVIEQAEKDFPNDLRGRIRTVDNFRQQSASHIRAYENAMAHGAEGPAIWKNYCESQLAGVSGAQRAMVQKELEQAASQSLKSEAEVLAQLKKDFPKEEWTPERLHEMAHSKDPAELDKFMHARNRIYEGRLSQLDELKKAYEAAPTEAERLRIAAQLNELQSDSLYFASEAYQTQGSIIDVVQNAQKAKGDVTSLHYGELVSNQARAAFNEQIGNAMAYGGSWPEVVKAGKYMGRAEKALQAHPFNAGKAGMSADLQAAMSGLEQHKALTIDAPELKNWASTHYPKAPDVKTALTQHRAALASSEKAMMAQMNGNVAALLASPTVWETIAKDPDKLAKVLKAMKAIATQPGDD